MYLCAFVLMSCKHSKQTSPKCCQEPHPHEPHAQQEDNYISDEQLEEEDPHDWINDFSAKEAPAGHISGLHDHEGIDKGTFRKMHSGWRSRRAHWCSYSYVALCFT